MEDATIVGVLDRVGEDGYHVGRRAQGHQRCSVLQPRRQRPARAEGRNHVTKRTNLADVEDRNDVGVVQTSGRTGLAQKAAAQVGGDQRLRPGHLDRHAPAKTRILSQVNDAEPAGAEHTQHSKPAGWGGAAKSVLPTPSPSGGVAGPSEGGCPERSRSFSSRSRHACMRSRRRRTSTGTASSVAEDARPTSTDSS